jgi:anti-sigma B factor antagonist
MNIVVNKLEGVTLIELPGRALDAGSAPGFKTATLNLLEPGARIVIDMGHLDFVDSTALGALVSCLRQAHSTQGEIKLCRLTKPVRTLFELVRMHRVFEIFDTVDDARKSYAA